MNSHFGIECQCDAPVEDAALEEIVEYAILHMKTEPIDPTEEQEKNQLMDVE